MSFGQAVAVVGRTEPVKCQRPHTAETYFVGRFRLRTPSGHVRRVDSRAAQRQAATPAPRGFRSTWGVRRSS